MKIAAFGEVLWDVIDGEYHLGGAALNFAAHAVQCGLPSSIISAVGNDFLGKKAIEKIESIYVSIEFLQISDKKTGTVEVMLNNGQPNYVIQNHVAYDNVLTDEIDFDLLKTYDCFYFGTLAQRNPISRACLKRILNQCDFDLVFLDVNLRQSFYSKQILIFSLNECNILKLNDEEVSILSQLLFDKSIGLEKFSTELLKQFPNISILIITKGAKGCMVYEDNKFIYIDSKPVNVADTIGAGDSFSAAFCAHYLKFNNAKAAANVANKIGGFVASQKGAIPYYNIEKFLRD